MRCQAFAGGKIAAPQGDLGEHVHAQAVDGRAWGLQYPEHSAGALGHLRRAGIGRTHQRRRHGRLAMVQPMGSLAEQRLAQRVDTDQLAAKRHQVQIGLEDLVLAPAALERARRQHLVDLLPHAAPAGTSLQLFIEQTGQLHRDGRCAAGAGVPQIGPRRAGHGTPVHAAVFVETLVFAEHQRRAQRRRHIGQGDPRPPAHREVGPLPMQHGAVTVQHQGFGWPVCGTHVGIPRFGRRLRGTQRQRKCQKRGTLWSHFGASTVTGAFGDSPNISGAYIASTRDGGRAKLPALFSRIVYCIRTTPLGRYS